MIPPNRIDNGIALRIIKGEMYVRNFMMVNKPKPFPANSSKYNQKD